MVGWLVTEFADMPKPNHRVEHAAIVNDITRNVAEIKKRSAEIRAESQEIRNELGRQKRRMRLAKNIRDMELPDAIRVEQIYEGDDLMWRVSWDGVGFLMDLRNRSAEGGFPFRCPVSVVETETPTFRKRLDAMCRDWSPAASPANVVVALYAEH